jgi:hypothetical protein
MARKLPPSPLQSVLSFLRDDGGGDTLVAEKPFSHELNGGPHAVQDHRPSTVGGPPAVAGPAPEIPPDASHPGVLRRGAEDRPEAWKERLSQARPGSHPSQIASEAMELADLEERLPSESTADRETFALDEVMALLKQPSSDG